MESAFHHVLVNQELKPYLGFMTNGRFFTYIAMCFGIKHAPWMFYKTLRPVMTYIKEELGVRGVAYCDDLIFLHQDKEALLSMVGKIVFILEAFGFKISKEKSVLIPKQEVEFLGWNFNMFKDELQMTK